MRSTAARACHRSCRPQTLHLGAAAISSSISFLSFPSIGLISVTLAVLDGRSASTAAYLPRQ